MHLVLYCIQVPPIIQWPHEPTTTHLKCKELLPRHQVQMRGSELVQSIKKIITLNWIKKSDFDTENVSYEMILIQRYRQNA